MVLLSSIISYPRTESTAYPSSFDLRSAVQEQTRSGEWGSYARDLLTEGLTKPKKGLDAGDHPPITPVCAASKPNASLDTPCDRKHSSWHPRLQMGWWEMQAGCTT